MDRAVVYIVEDQEEVRQSLLWTVQSQFEHQVDIRAYANAAELLQTFEPNTHGCLLLDLGLPDMSGLELRDELVKQNCQLPFIIITGKGELPDALRAMRQGAVNFITKPVEVDMLVESIAKALERDRERLEYQQTQERMSTLSRRELEVLDLIVQGMLNKNIARELSVSVKTIESHRGKIMRKLGAESLAHLVRLVLEFRKKRKK